MDVSCLKASLEINANLDAYTSISESLTRCVRRVTDFSRAQSAGTGASYLLQTSGTPISISMFLDIIAVLKRYHKAISPPDEPLGAPGAGKRLTRRAQRPGPRDARIGNRDGPPPFLQLI